MVEQEFIDRFKNILANIVSKKGDVSVFALLKMDDLTDKWTVILAAPWVTDTDRGEIFFLLREEMVTNLETEELQTIARFGIWPTSEHLISLLLDNYTQGDYISQDTQINGNLIHEGYILASNKTIDQERIS